MRACIYIFKNYGKFPLNPSTGETGQSSELENFIFDWGNFREEKLCPMC